MKRPRYEVADILRADGKAFLALHPQPAHHLRTLQALMQCRTGALGGHVDQCDGCGYKRISFNSCRNRHCPKCQGLARERWVRAREADLLPVSYFHLVFTLPHQLHPLCMAHPEHVYPMLFHAAWNTLQVFAADHTYLAAMTAILHTWGQTLTFHPHIHGIVPAGGITHKGSWKAAKGKGKFLFPVKAMKKVFRGKFVHALKRAWKQEKLTDQGVKGQPLTDDDFEGLRRSLYRKPWVIFAKKPFAGPKQVIQYLGRYSHRIAISNHRICQVADGKVRFAYKDYRKGGKKAEITLEATEFLRRFALHILPHRFVRIRHFGFLAPNLKAEALTNIRQHLKVETPTKPPKLNWKQLLKQTTGFDIDLCPKCKTANMKCVQELPRAPPKHILFPVG